MKYHLCSGVSLEHVCGIHLLIASGQALSRLEYVRVINDVGADILEKILKKEETEDIIYQLSQEYEMNKKDIRNGIFRFLKDLEEKGYLIPDEGGH